MRYFEGDINDKPKILIYDTVMEFILETTLSFLSDTDWDVQDTAKILDGWRWEKNLGEYFSDVMGYKDADISEIREEKGKYVKKIRKVFNNPEYAITEIARLELLSDENIDDLGKNNQLRKKIVSVPCLWRFGSPSPAALYVTTILGYTLDLDTGITKGLHSTKHTLLFDKLEEIWDNAVKELHPFQRGPTHQGTKHCVQILDNLHSLCQGYPSIKSGDALDNIEKRVLMSIAAALHDVGKGDLLADPPPAKDYHARNCAKLILGIPDIFSLDGIDSSCIELICKIVEMHNPEDQTDNINQLKSRKIEDTGLQIGKQDVETQYLCALFHLSDVMDTTRHRVSDPAFGIVKYLHPGNSGFYSIEKLVNARKGMLSRTVVPGASHIEVMLSKVMEFRNAASDRIDVENEDLKETGAEEVLHNQSWPEKLEGR